MTVGILSTEFYLIDNWPGVPIHGPNPADWTAVSASEDFPLGTKRMVYDTTNKGWATLMYLKFVDGAVPEPGLAAGKFPICGMHTAAAASGDYYAVGNDASIVDLAGPIAIALGLVTTAAPYGWFWVGGVCPEATITALNDMAYVCNDGVTAQSHMIMASSASYVAFNIGSASHIGNFSAYSLVANATA